MTNAVVQAEGVGKKYLIRQPGPFQYVALRDVIADWSTDVARRVIRRRSGGGRRREEMWALRDVSFELRDGDRMGLVGRNGAGKSTLLKILSRITEPSEGRVRLRGRVASLLEVGTGFHPELSGRENVYLNGTILGMRRSEIQRKFDEIVAFAEVERFLDTPVKQYSSGMYVRLAFAVAAHLEQEILLVDEVLAVGDAAFQRKCLAKMGEVAREGRTIVLVSHNLVAVEQLCKTALWLEGGRMVGFGAASDITGDYNRSFASAPSGSFEPSMVSGDGTLELLSYSVRNAAGEPAPLPVTGEDVLVELRIRVHAPIERPAVGAEIWSPTGVLLSRIDPSLIEQDLEPWTPGDRTVTLRLCAVPYLPGSHRIDLWIQRAGRGGQVHARANGAIAVEIGESELYGTSRVRREVGCVYTRLEVSSLPVDSTEAVAGVAEPGQVGRVSPEGSALGG